MVLIDDYPDLKKAELALNGVIQRVPNLTEAEVNELTNFLLRDCSVIEKPAGYLLIEAGQLSGCFYICLQGLLRNYYSLSNGKIFNKSFITSPGIAGSLSEYVKGEASRFSIDCLEESLLLKLRFDWFRTVQSNPLIQKFYLHIVEGLAILKEKREASLLFDNAQERYLDFMNHYEHLQDRIPDYQIAAYLGITAVAFSRLKNKVS